MVYDRDEFEDILMQLFDYVVARDWVAKFNFEAGRTGCLRGLHAPPSLSLTGEAEKISPRERVAGAQARLAGRPHQVDEGGRRFVEIPLLPEYLSAVVLGSKSNLREKEVQEILRDRFGDVPVMRSKLR
jgi:hypothetical protein